MRRSAILSLSISSVGLVIADIVMTIIVVTAGRSLFPM